MHDSDDINPHVDWDDDDDLQDERRPPSQPQITPADADDEISLLGDDDNQDALRETPHDARKTPNDAHTTAGAQEIPLEDPSEPSASVAPCTPRSSERSPVKEDDRPRGRRGRDSDQSVLTLTPAPGQHGLPPKPPVVFSPSYSRGNTSAIVTMSATAMAPTKEKRPSNGQYSRPTNDRSDSLPHPWKRVESTTVPGEFYFMNDITGLTTWERPKDSTSRAGHDPVSRRRPISPLQTRGRVDAATSNKENRRSLSPDSRRRAPSPDRREHRMDVESDHLRTTTKRQRSWSPENRDPRRNSSPPVRAGRMRSPPRGPSRYAPTNDDPFRNPQIPPTRPSTLEHIRFSNGSRIGRSPSPSSRRHEFNLAPSSTLSHFVFLFIINCRFHIVSFLCDVLANAGSSLLLHGRPAHSCPPLLIGLFFPYISKPTSHPISSPLASTLEEWNSKFTSTWLHA